MRMMQVDGSSLLTLVTLATVETVAPVHLAESKVLPTLLTWCYVHLVLCSPLTSPQPFIRLV